MKKMIFIAFIGIAVVFGGCQRETTNIDIANDEGKAVAELDYRDFDKAATNMVQSMLSSGVFRRQDGSRFVVTTAKVTNDTMQRIDTDQLTFKIEQELMNSGQVVMSAAVGGKGAPDQMVYQLRDLRDSEKADEFKKDTMPGKGQIVSPELSISGKIFQKNIRYDNNTQQIEYYFQLRVSNISSGLSIWQNESLIGKRADKRAVPW